MILRPRPGGLREEQLAGSSEIIQDNRTLTLLGEVSSSAIVMRDDLRVLARESKKPIRIEIISGGGLVMAGLALFSTIRSLNQAGVPIYTVGYTAYSIAALILAAGDKGHRYIAPEGTVMIHASSYVGGMGVVNQADLNILKKNDKILIDIIAELTGKTTEQRDELYRTLADQGQDKWFNAQEAVEFGLADEILTPETAYNLFVRDLDVSSWEEAKSFTRKNPKK